MVIKDTPYLTVGLVNFHPHLHPAFRQRANFLLQLFNILLGVHEIVVEKVRLALGRPYPRSGQSPSSIEKGCELENIQTNMEHPSTEQG